MRAVILSGRPSTRQEITSLLSVSEDVARPSLKADQVLVRVVATALNIEDIMTAVGRRIGVSLIATPEDPVVLGQEFAGVVEEVGGKVKKFAVGDAVLGRKVSCQSSPFGEHFVSFGGFSLRFCESWGKVVAPT